MKGSKSRLVDDGKDDVPQVDDELQTATEVDMMMDDKAILDIGDDGEFEGEDMDEGEEDENENEEDLRVDEADLVSTQR